MTELPIVVTFFSWGTALLGVIGLALFLPGFIRMWRSNDPIGVGPLALMLLAIGSGLYFLLWGIPAQFRLEDRGIVERAPFNFLASDGAIAWVDILSVEMTAIRGWRPRVPTSHALQIIGRDGTEIALGVDALPASFGPLLQKIFEERAPQVKDREHIAELLADARASAPLGLGPAVWIRDAHGEPLR